jgi:transposase
VEQVITAMLEQAPPKGGTHWSTRSMARSAGMSQTAISRIWRAFGLKPHLVETWKLSTDPQFIEKVRDVVGLYMDPPEMALVLCVDEKSQIQALDRTAPCLPVLPTTPARMTHDYVRNGTTSLFAALDVASGSVIAQHYRRHRHQEFLRFLKLIDDAVPDGLDLHLICDNYATHKTPAVQKWLLRHPRFHLHFTPTSSSWLNLIERWFAELTNRKLRRSAHRSVTELEAGIRKWIIEWNQDPKPFVWTKTANKILEDPQPTAAGLTAQQTTARYQDARGRCSPLLPADRAGRRRAGPSWLRATRRSGGANALVPSRALLSPGPASTPTNSTPPRLARTASRNPATGALTASRSHIGVPCCARFCE